MIACKSESKLKVAIVHDWLLTIGGAEKVLKDLHELFPEAPIYTLIYDEARAPSWTQSCDIRTSLLQRIPFGRRVYKHLLPIMPHVWENVDLTEYDLVISSSMSCCKGVITSSDAVHVSYCHSPTRYLWDMSFSYMESKNFLIRTLMFLLFKSLRTWDYSAAQRVDFFVANSNFIASRIKKFYKRDSEVIYPGVDKKLSYGENIGASDDPFYLIVARLVDYKRIDLAIKACNELQRKLVIVGSAGEEAKKLQSIAGPTIEFKGRISDSEIAHLFENARAFLFPGLEDFGIAPVEAMQAGLPVIAYGRGGALETVLDGKTGVVFSEQSVESLCAALKKFESDGVEWSKDRIMEHAKQFSTENFKTMFSDFIEEVALRELSRRRKVQR